MEKFLNLPQEKQDIIISAAMSCFGSLGYKKASVNDIAVASGISKAMVFYYFGSKKDLYFYLITLSVNVMKSALDSQVDRNAADFFEKIKLAAEAKISVLKRYSGILSFLTSVYFETDAAVYEEIQKSFSEHTGYGKALALEHTDIKKFKEDVDPQLVLDILITYSEGYVSKASGHTEVSPDTLHSDFNRCLELMKNHFYKKEYLK